MKKILIALILVLVGFGAAYADLENLGDYGKTRATLSAGYNWVETKDNPGRAAEYEYHDVSGTAAFDIRGGVNDTHFIFNGDYLNEHDFVFTGHLDRNNAQRLNLRIEKMYHNLDHIDYANRPDAIPDFTTGTPATRADFSDANPEDEYALNVSTYEANLRMKLPDMPSHVNVGYWQFTKQGESQLRFVDENCAGACHLQSKTRELDRTTHQVTGGFDAHLGKFDLILKHTYRELVVNDPIPVDAFDTHNRLRPAAGNYQHSEDPESQLNETTLELHTSFAGGLNLAASGTVGKRKNNSKLTDVSPVIAETDYWKAAADVTHTPSARFSYNFKVRYLDMDANNNYPGLIDPFTSGVDASGIDTVDVRPPIDLSRASYELVSSLRPNQTTTYKATLKVEQTKRTETGPALPFHSNSGGVFINDPVWELPDEEMTTTAKIGFMTRVAGSTKFKVNGYYQYQNTDKPAYGASFKDSQTLFLSSTYALNPNWGMLASARASFDKSNNFEHDVVLDETTVPITLRTIDRDREQENLNLGVWYNSPNNVTTAMNYGYFRTAIVQDLMFGTNPNSGGTDYIIIDKDVDYLQEVHTLSGSIGFPLLGNMKAHLAAYYTHSIGYYDPDFPVASYPYTGGAATGDVSSDGLKQITHYDIDQFGGKATVDFYLTPDFELSLHYAYDEYNEKYNDIFDGRVQSVMTNLAYRF